MLDGKVFQLVGSMNKHDANRFEKYLLSPYFNSNTELLVFFQTLFNQKTPKTRQEVYLKSTGRKKYDDKHFRYLTSFLATHLENFFALQDLQADPVQQAHLTMRSVARRDCEKSFNYLHDHFTRKAQEKSTHGEDFYYFRYKASGLRLSYLSQKQNRKKLPRFDEVMNELDKFYLSRKLQIACEMVNAGNVLSAGYEIPLLQEIQSLLSKNYFADEPSIRVYHTILLTLTEPEDESHAATLEKLVKKYSGKFPPADQRNILLYLKNYCIKKLNQGRHEYVEKLFDIYQIMLSEEKLMRSEYLSQWEFKNMVSVALRLKKMSWAKEFIEKYTSYLRPEEQRNARLFNMANWHFYNKEYGKALKLLQSVEFTDLYYQLDSRSILLRLYFESDDDDAFFFQASAFRVFLSRNRLISSYQRTIYRNFIRYAIKILRAGSNPSKLKRLQEEVGTVKQIADLRWIEEKISAAME